MPTASCREPRLNRRGAAVSLTALILTTACGTGGGLSDDELAAACRDRADSGQELRVASTFRHDDGTVSIVLETDSARPSLTCDVVASNGVVLHLRSSS